MTTYTKASICAAILTLSIAYTHAATAGARTNEINQRFTNQEEHIAAGVNDGQISSTKAATDEARITRMSSTLTADQEAGGGHISQSQAAQLNYRLNANEGAIYNQRH